MKKHFLLLVFSLALGCFCNAQTDSLNAGLTGQRIPGIYKSFEEFISNSPSLTEGYSITHIISKNDSTVIAAYIAPIDPGRKKIEKSIWGFCDGADVYVRYNNNPPMSGQPGKIPYWKLESIGAYSYFNIPRKNVVLAGPLPMQVITGALTAAGPVSFDCFVIDPKGKIKFASIRSTEKYLADHTDLLKSFQKDSEPCIAYEYGNGDAETDEIHDAKLNLIKIYLSKLNEKLLKSPPGDTD